MNTMLWYPPAETRIRLRSFARAAFAGKEDLAARLCSVTETLYCVLGGSGRALMTLLLHALRQADTEGRDQVLVPAYTCYSVAASVVRAGLKIAVYDLDPRTFQPDEASLRRAAGRATLAVVHQHLFGIPQPVEHVRKVADRLGIPVIEDAAQGLGGSLKNTPMGAMGDYAIFSFGRGKPLPVGCGGALVGRGQVLETLVSPGSKSGFKQLCRSIAVHALSHPLLYGVMEMLPLGLGETIFDPEFTISGMPAAMKRLAERSLENIDKQVERRRDIAAVYRLCLDGSRIVPEPEGARPAYPRFPYLAGPGALDLRLLRLGVRRMYPRAIIDEPEIAKFIARPVSPAPGARQIARDLITLPTHSKVTPSMARKISGLFMEKHRCQPCCGSASV